MPSSFTPAASLGVGVIRRAATWACDSGAGVVVATTRGVALYRFDAGAWVEEWFRPSAAWVTSVSVSASGRRVAAATHEGQIMVWDAASGVAPAEQTGQQAGEQASGQVGEQVIWPTGRGKTYVALDRDGERLAVGDRAGVTLWSVATGELLGELAGASQEVTALAFHPAGDQVAAADYSGQALLWDAGTARELRRWKHAGPVRGLAFFPDGERLATVGKDFTIWDIAMDVQVSSATAPGPMLSVAVAAGGERAVTGTSRGRALLWDLATGERSTLASHLDELHSVSFMPLDSSRDLVMLASQKLSLVDLHTGDSVAAVPAFARPMSAQVAAGDGDARVVIADKQVITTWSDAGVPGAVLDGHTHTVKGVWICDEGRRLISHSPREVIGWDAATGARRFTIQAPGGIGGAAMDRGGTQLAVALERDRDTRLVLCDPGSGDELDEIATLQRRGAGVSELVLGSGGHLAVRESTRITIWDVAARVQRHAIDRVVNRDGVMVWSPAGDILATALATGEVVLWEARSGRKRHVLQGGGGGGATILTYSDDGALLAGAFKSRPADQVFVWDGQSGRTIHGPWQAGQLCHALALRPDNSTLVAGFSDGQQSGSWTAWHLATGDVIVQHAGEPIWAVAFSASGVLLVTAAGAGVATIWTTITKPPS